MRAELHAGSARHTEHMTPEQRHIAEEAARTLEQAARYLELGWVRGIFAEDIHGQPCRWDSDVAVAWCINGAVARACRLPTVHVVARVRAAVGAAARSRGAHDVGLVNDAPDFNQTKAVAFVRGVRDDILKEIGSP